MNRFHLVFAAASISLATAGSALARPTISMGSVLGDAAPVMKLLMFLLIVGMIAAIAIAARKIAAGPALVGGSAFLSALRLGGPLVGLLGAAFNGLMMFIGIANSPEPVPFALIAPGLAEAAFVATLGLLTGVVAVICNWAVDSRIDRAVLRP